MPEDLNRLHVVASDEPGDDDGTRFERLYREHFRAVYTYVLRRVGLADVPDLVAEVFTTAWRRMEQVPRPPDDRLWLYGVSHRVVSQHHRGRRRRQRLVAKVGSTLALSDRTAPGYDDPPRVVGVLNGLKARDRELVRLVVWEQLSHAEVAAILGCSANAVAIRWHRSIARLRRDLGVAADLTAAGAPEAFAPVRTEGTP